MSGLPEIPGLISEHFRLVVVVRSIESGISIILRLTFRLVQLIAARSPVGIVAARPPALAAVFGSFPVIATTVAVRAAFATRTSVPVLRPRPALRLNIPVRLFNESLAGEPHLPCLRVNFKKLHIHFIADIDDILDLVGLAPVKLRDVKKSFLARENLDECAELKH